MSGVGDDVTWGTKGSNYHFQKSLLLAIGQNQTVLQAILGALGGSVSNAFTGPVRVVGPGVIPANSKSFSVYNAGGANGVFNGGVIKSGEQLSGASTAPISYDGTGTELVITYIL